MDIPRLLAILCLAGGSMMTPGCSTLGPVNNVDNAPIYQNDGPKDLQQVRDAIVAGLDEKGWGVLDESQGWLLARVDAGDHWAKIRITYDTKSYTILHFESSPGLGYNGAEIHRRYNNWIEMLDEVIQEELHSPGDDDDDDDDDDDNALADHDEASDDDALADSAGADPAAVPGEGPSPEPDPSWTEPTAEEAPPA